MYPKNYTEIDILYDECFSGYPIIEYQTIPRTYQITLKHLAKKNTIKIQGMKEVFTSPNQNEFQVIDYKINTNTRSNINYEIGQNILFHESALGSTYKIEYSTCGDKINSIILNKLKNAILNIQKAIGLIKENSDLDLKTYTNICDYISMLKKQIKTHSHSGGKAFETTKQLTMKSLEKINIKDKHISDNANISTAKIENCIKEIGNDSFSYGCFNKTILCNKIKSDSKIYVTRTYGEPFINGYFWWRKEDIIENTSFILRFEPEIELTSFDVNSPLSCRTSIKGNIYVLSEGKVKVYNQYGDLINIFGNFPNANHCIVTPKEEYCFISDHETHKIYKYTGTGTYIAEYGGYGTGNGQFNKPSGLSLINTTYDGSSYNIIICDYSNERMQIINGDTGSFVNMFTYSSLGNPYRVASSYWNDLYIVANKKIFYGWIYGIDGILCDTGTNSNQTNNPKGIGVGGEDYEQEYYIYITDDDSLIKYSRGRKFFYKYGSKTDILINKKFGNCHDIGILPNKKICLADFDNNKIWIFNLKCYNGYEVNLNFNWMIK